MMIKLAIFAIFCYFTCQGLFLDGLQRNNTCSSDTDCPGGCCHLDYHGTRCHNYSHEAQPCHLPNHHINVMLYPCGCAQGLTCKEIHFHPSLHVPDANGTDVLGQVETLLLGHGYGLCEK